MVCLNCLPACPEQAMSYSALPPLPEPPQQPDLSRRTLVGTVLASLAIAPLLRATGGGRTAARARLLRPPGALAETDFLERCVKCSLCQQACPTGAIQSAIAEARQQKRAMTDLGGPICVPEMRIEPDRMHPTPVEEYSKMVRARIAMLAVQARAAAAAAAGNVPVELR